MKLENIRIVLVDPIYGGNVGSVCRAMANMGVRELYLVKPQIVWFAHRQTNVRTADGGLDEACAGLEPKIAPGCPAALAIETRNATRPVAAHLRFATVCVVVAHEEIGGF